MGKHNRSDPVRRAKGISRILVPTVVGTMIVSGIAAGAVRMNWNEPPPSGGGGNTISSGTDPNIDQLSLGAQWQPFSPAPGVLASTPLAFSFDQLVKGQRTKKTLLNVQGSEDSSTSVLNMRQLAADDNNNVFGPLEGLGKDWAYGSMGRMRDGSILATMFRPGGAPAPNRVSILMARSTDLGAHWAKWSAPLVENKWKLGYYRLNGRDIIELNDGTLLTGAYGSLTGSCPPPNTSTAPDCHAVVLQSTDAGKTWSQRSEISTDHDSTEFTLSRTTDGRLIEVSRAGEAHNSPTRAMKQAFSDDNGLTWTPEVTFVPPPGLPVEGIQPQLVLQTNGSLVLSYGRPDNYVAVSWDGTGRTWDAGQLVYSNYIRDSFLGRWMGSSGNTSLVPQQANSSVQFGDLCVVIWSCQEYGQQNGIYARRVDAVTAGKGKLDLATGVADGTMKISGAVAAADPRFAEQRIQGAVDGSNEYRAAARLAAGAPKRIDVQLDRVYTLDKIGLMLDRGAVNSARVQLSVDGKNWSTPVVRQQKSTDYAVRYHRIAPTRAKYIRVSNVGADPFTALNELELYASNIWTFENDAVNVTPRGTTDTLHAFTADTLMPGQHSQRRAIIVDTDPDTMGTMTFPVAEALGLHLGFGYAGEGYGTGANWELLGKGSDGRAVSGWKFHFRPGGAGFILTAWDGSAWQQVGEFPTFTPNYQWIPVEINANGKQAAITVHGKTLTTTVHAADAVLLNGFRPSTGLAVADTNMEHSYDNLEITPLANYTIGAAEPGMLQMYPGTTATTSISVQNFTDRAMVLPVTVAAINGYRVKAPARVRVKPNSSVAVAVTITRTTRSDAARQLVVLIGNQKVTVPIIAQSDWARIATMTASSSSTASSPTNLNTGNTDSSVWGSGGAGGWNDSTSKTWPDWVVATWAQPVTVSKVDVYTLDSAKEPASTSGVRDYDLQVKTAAGDWQTVDEVRGNTAGKVRSTFDPVQTTAIRVLITDTNDHAFSRLIAVQAFSS